MNLKTKSFHCGVHSWKKNNNLSSTRAEILAKVSKFYVSFEYIVSL